MCSLVEILARASKGNIEMVAMGLDRSEMTGTLEPPDQIQVYRFHKVYCMFRQLYPGVFICADAEGL